MNEKISIALPKGYLFSSSIEILRKAGFDVKDLEEGNNRKLVVKSEKDNVKYVIARPMDVPIYVEYGACDVGFAGKDVLVEKESNVYELLDLKTGVCRLIVATLKDRVEKVKEHYEHFGCIRVATKYPNVTQKYFDRKGMQVEIIKLYGSVELAPVLGISDEIVDITATGRTLEENNLVEMENIMVCTARLIANIVSYRMKYGAINELIKAIRRVI
ncbi:MAG: ATP phosphoribosyltransferase [Actinobacteria bacterium]|nr:ATP phosphoribosyltransferase [Actinomycetota bacterium]